MFGYHPRPLAAVIALAPALALIVPAAPAPATPARAVPAALSTHAHATPARDQGRARLLVVRASHPAPPGLTPPPPGYRPPREPDPAAYSAQKRAANATAAHLTAAHLAASHLTASVAADHLAAAYPAGAHLAAAVTAPAQSSPASPPRAPSGAAASVAGPGITHNWVGQRDTSTAPSDSTGAIGTGRYIELVNARAAIYTRAGGTPTVSGPLVRLTGCGTSACTDTISSPQIIWDPGTRRFFYAAEDVVSSSQNLLSVGFSTTANPTLSEASWCRYNLNFGASVPDYPMLGDTRDFQLVGVNEFTGSTFAGSVIAWLTKPPSGSACPKATSFKAGITGTLKNADGTRAFTPVPANQTDTGPAGWAVARPASMPGGSAAFFTVFGVTASASGTASIPTTGTKIGVAAYKVPAAAPQEGSTSKLDTLDARLTQAVSAVDPAHGSVTALWTQHAVFGGAGAQERWYEINPAKHRVIQHGTLTSTSSFIFDGAVSPDRRVNGASAMFGGDMVIDVVQSSATTFPAIEVASKAGSNPVSALTPVVVSPAADTGPDCTQGNGTCLWGRYAAATPDPVSASAGTAGQVWGSSMLVAAASSAGSDWATRNFAIRP
jgi:hypothetical protein